ncbi:MAG TPA: divalent metal cation transporter [Bacillota bacterium]|nr:divalent metal cation transporter [Bacillota bacterium]
MRTRGPVALEATRAASPGTGAPPSSGGAPVITHEDIDRARDRLALERARAGGRFSGLWLLWLLVGPGMLVMLGENDAPSMLSYAATGSGFPLGFFLPFVVVTFGMAYVVQEMTVRLGAVSHRGHAELIFDRFGRFWGAFAMGDLVLGNFLTLITEFIGVRAGLGFFGVPPLVAVGGSLLVVLAAALTHRYWTWERLTMALAVCNGVFIPVALLVHPHWGAVGHALLTWGPLPGGLHAGTLTILVADIGATVTPWMLFFQQGAVVDKGLQPRDIRAGRIDTAIGTVLATLFALACIIATSPLHAHGMSAGAYQTADFARALLPYAGRVGATLFALGIFEAGLVAAITISTSSAYAFGEVTHTSHSLNRPVSEGWPFYTALIASATLAGALVLVPHAPLELVVLTVNVIAVLSMPPALIFLLLLVNDPEVMGEMRNGPWSNALALTVGALLLLAGLLFATSVLAPGLFAG